MVPQPFYTSQPVKFLKNVHGPVTKDHIVQRFFKHGSQPKCESPRLRRWVSKACKLPHLKEKDLRTRDFKNENSFLRELYDFKTKIKKSESD